MECGAKKRDKTPCRAQAMPNGRCRIHGGKSLKGIASPAYKTGRYSRYLPGRLAERYGEAKTDPDLLALHEDVALTDARLSDVLGRVDTGESGDLWRKARGAFEAFREAQGKREVDKARAALTDLDGYLARGVSDYATWDEVGRLLEQRRRLVESERKRLIEMQQMITAEKAVLLIGAIAGIIKIHVSDRGTLAAISADIGKLVTADASV